MRYIKTYESYKDVKKIEEKWNKNILLLHDVELSNSDEKLFIEVFEKLLKNYKVDESIKLEIRQYIEETQLLNEGFFDKFKERFTKAAEVSKKLSDKGEEVLGKILDASKDAVSFTKKIGEGIKKLFIEVIESGKKYFQEQLTTKLKGKIEEVVKNDKEGLISDLKTIREVLNFYRKDFLGKLLKTKEENMVKVLTSDLESVAESMINEEKGNVISTFVHNIEKIPPFNLLHKVEVMGKKGAESLIKVASEITQKLGGPNFELPVVAIFVGIAVEYATKSSGGGFLLNLAGSGTPFGLAIIGIKYLASFIAVITAIDAIIGGKLLG